MVCFNARYTEIAIALYFKSRAEYYIGVYSACIRDLNEFEALGFNAPQAYELKANAYIGLNDYASAKKYQKLALKSEADYVKQKTNNVNRPVNNGRQNSGQYDTSTNYYRSGSRGIQKR